MLLDGSLPDEIRDDARRVLREIADGYSPESVESRVIGHLTNRVLIYWVTPQHRVVKA